MNSNRLTITVPTANTDGFTLIEVLIAMAIFLIGFLAVGAMQISAVNSNANARMRTEATMIAAQHAERLLALDFADLEAVVASNEYDEPNKQGLYEIERPTITNFVNGEELTTSNNKTINVTVTWKKRGRTQSVTYSVMAVDM